MADARGDIVSERLRFGIFMAPFHPAGDNPTLALERDLELIQHLDRLGWDEAWIGEHHSAGTEIIASPEIFIARRRGANPSHQARYGRGQRQLSQSAVGRRAGRAARPSHARPFHARPRPGLAADRRAMVGLDQSQTRELLAEGIDIIMRLLTTDEPVTFKNDRWDLRDARLHLRPYSSPLFDVAVAAVASPAGPQLAGKHGIGLLSVGATQAAGFDALALHWDVMARKRAAHFGTTVDRSKWRLVGLMHCRRDPRAGLRDVEYGIEQWFHYFQTVAAFPQMAVEGDTIRRDDRLRQRLRPRFDRHCGRCGRADRSAGQAVQRRLRLLPGPRPRVGQPGGHPSQLRADRPARDAAVPRAGVQHLQAKARAEASRPELAAAHMQAVEDVTAAYHAEVGAAPPTH